jgi:ribose transport system substrate-binding protein
MISRSNVTSQRPPPAQRQGQQRRPSRRPPPTARPTAAKVCRIALFQMNDGDYQRLLREDCLREARRYDFPVRTFSADNDSDKQIEQIHACLKEQEATRPTAILVCPVRDAALVSTAYAAARLGIGWVLLGRWSVYMATLREAFPRLPVFSVAADQKEIGRIQGRQVRALLPHGGDLLYIRGPLGISSAARRFEGVQETLHDSSIKTSTVSSDWTGDGGQRAMSEWLQVLGKGDLSRFVVAAQNDAMAMGARNALAMPSVGRSNPSIVAIPVVGCDGTPDYGRRLVIAGKLTATVIMPPTTGRAVQEIASMLDGNARTDSEIVLAPSSFPELVGTGRLPDGTGARTLDG